jgi:predicted nucleic acid-binding protein
MAGELLLDTGALVALLDRSQREHQNCKAFFETWEGAVVTTEAVLTEATHLLARVAHGREACLDLVLEAGILVAPSTNSSLKRCRKLIATYANVPMDFADATLVALGEELHADLIFTTDSDFRIYRMQGRRAFRVVPEP